MSTVCTCLTDDRSPVTDHSDSSSPVSDSDDAGLLALDSQQVYNSSAGQLITVVSAAASASQSQ